MSREGHVFEILDSDANVLSGPKTGIWIDNVFHQTINGKVIIPYQKSKTQKKMVVVHENFSVLKDIEL